MTLVGINVDRPDAPCIVRSYLVPFPESKDVLDGLDRSVSCKYKILDMEEDVKRTSEEHEYGCNEESCTS